MLTQAIAVGVSRHDRWKMVFRFLTAYILDPAPWAPRSGSARRSAQRMAVSPRLLLCCCFLVAVKGLCCPVSLLYCLGISLLYRSLSLFSACCPLLSGSVPSAALPSTVSTPRFLTHTASHGTCVGISEDGRQENEGTWPIFVHGVQFSKAKGHKFGNKPCKCC